MNEPELRFKANDGQEYPEWEEKKIINYFSNIRNGFVGTITNSFSDKINGIRYLEGVNIHDGIISDNVELYVTKEFHEAHINNELKATDILMVQSGHVGDCAVVGERYQGSNCHALIIMSNNGKADSLFVVDYFHSPKGIKDLSFLIKGNTVKHILASDIREYRMKFPCLEEQQKIADLFSILDNVIDSVQKEVDSWEQMKRGVMQKLFSQEVRFKADDGSEFPNWTMIKADGLLENITDKNHPEDTVLTIIQGAGTVPRENAGRNIQYDKKYLSTYKRVEKNDFIIHLRSFEGGLEIANETGIVSPAYVILRSKKEIAPGFYNAYFHSNEFIHHNLPRTVEGIRDGRQISYTAFKQLYLPWCCFEEQQKIADCLSEFDSVIEKTKQKLKAYKELKKGLMQRMFV